MARPFEGIFGDTSELRLIQFVLPLRDLEFNISELAKEVGVSRQTMSPIVKKFLNWGLLKIASKHGKINYYTLNEDSNFINTFENLNNCIVEQMLGEEMLIQIADYSLKHNPVCTFDNINSENNFIGVTKSEVCSSPEDYLEFSSHEKSSDNPWAENEVVPHAAA